MHDLNFYFKKTLKLGSEDTHDFCELDTSPEESIFLCVWILYLPFFLPENTKFNLDILC